MKLYNRLSSFYIVINVPKCLRKRIGKSQIWRSLHTKDRRIANLRAGMIKMSVHKLQFLIYNIIKIAIPESKALQRGLTEAMTNSVQHAYPDDFVEESTLKDKLWWMSASINVRTKMLTIMFYDEGIGIPKSLPRTYPEIFRSLGGLLNDDAQLIQAATKIKRSSTNKKNRGRGLKDIKDYVKSVNNGMLKILSQRGEYAYFSNEKEYIKNRNIPLCGTLIQWKVPINIGE